jgi:hypothetical protein
LERSLVAHVEASQPDLVIKSTRAPPTVPMAALLQTDWMLAHALSAPLLLVSGKPWSGSTLIAMIRESDTDAHEAVAVTAQRLCWALAATVETAPARWSDAGRLIDYLRNRGASLVAMPWDAVRTTNAAARILDELEADLLIVPTPRGP